LLTDADNVEGLVMSESDTGAAHRRGEGGDSRRQFEEFYGNGPAIAGWETDWQVSGGYFGKAALHWINDLRQGSA
jgi:hypothetical protein